MVFNTFSKPGCFLSRALYSTNRAARSWLKSILHDISTAVSAKLTPSNVNPVLDLNDSRVLPLPAARGGIRFKIKSAAKKFYADVVKNKFPGKKNIYR